MKHVVMFSGGERLTPGHESLARHQAENDDLIGAYLVREMFAEIDAMRRERMCSGDKACGRPIPVGEEYRCLDCDAVMHKDCLRWHCSNDEKDRTIFSQQGTIAELRAQLSRVCSVVINERNDPTKPVGGGEWPS